MMEFSHTEGRVNVRLRALSMGEDLCVLLDGGQKPHIGAVATAYTQGAANSCLPGHREDILAQHMAQGLQNSLSCTVTCICGIHIPQITREEIAQVYAIAELLLQQYLSYRAQQK